MRISFSAYPHFFAKIKIFLKIEKFEEKTENRRYYIIDKQFLSADKINKTICKSCALTVYTQYDILKM